MPLGHISNKSTIDLNTKVVDDMEGSVVYSPTDKEIQAGNENLGSDLLTQIQ